MTKKQLTTIDLLLLGTAGRCGSIKKKEFTKRKPISKLTVYNPPSFNVLVSGLNSKNYRLGLASLYPLTRKKICLLERISNPCVPQWNGYLSWLTYFN